MVNEPAWTGMHEPVWMLLHAATAAAATACMRACVAARVIDTVYQLIYSSAQTQAWRIEISYRYIRKYWMHHLRRKVLES